jgi:tRNA G18 (ribose-2'-O)-methylase SpoU
VSRKINESIDKVIDNTNFILGNEVTGVDTRVMDKSDLIVEIPTFGVKNSLNVASAGPIVLFECLRQWNKK